MEDILFLNERVSNAIKIGESDFREFKSAYQGKPDNKKPRPVKEICRDIAEGLVAFANTDGGELIIGVEDDGTITGVPHSEKDIAIMLKAGKSHVFDGQVLPLDYSVKLVIDDKIVLFFQVQKGTHEIFQLPDGRVVERQDKRTVPATVKHLQFKQQEIISRAYDRQYVDGATVNDLDFSLVQSFADSFLKGITIEKYLQQLGLAEYSVSGFKIRRAALLLFTKDIQKWCPNSKVRFLKVSGTTLESGHKYNVISDEMVQGNIYELLYKSWEGVRPYLAYKTVFGPGAIFEQQYIYPEEACREALVNAIVHRDYISHNGVEVYIYDDRMEIKSPGALLSTITINILEELENRHESRNSKIAYVLKVSNLMRELGEGMKRIFTSMQEKELRKPKLYSNTSWFTVTLFNKSVYSEEQQKFLKHFDKFKLSVNQKKIVLLGIDGKAFAQADIYKAMNTKDKNVYDNEIKKLKRIRILIESKTDKSTPTKTDNASTTSSGKTIIKIMDLLPPKIKKEYLSKYKIQIPQ